MLQRTLQWSESVLSVQAAIGAPFEPQGAKQFNELSRLPPFIFNYVYTSSHLLQGQDNDKQMINFIGEQRNTAVTLQQTNTIDTWIRINPVIRIN